ncbi:hypothetical protein RI054_24g101990 [Pseudoscourfieldia marina]
MAAVAQEPPEIVALRLQLQIAEAQRDQAVAEAQGRAVAPVGQQPVQLNYLLPRDFEEVVSADLFPRDGVDLLCDATRNQRKVLKRQLAQLVGLAQFFDLAIQDVPLSVQSVQEVQR